jgi:hypothetical protein
MYIELKRWSLVVCNRKRLFKSQVTKKHLELFWYYQHILTFSLLLTYTCVKCVISGIHRGVNLIFVLMWFYAALQLQIFWGNLSVTSSRVNQSKKRFPFDCLTTENETDVLSRNFRNYQSTLRSIPEELWSRIFVYFQREVSLKVGLHWSGIT